MDENLEVVIVDERSDDPHSSVETKATEQEEPASQEELGTLDISCDVVEYDKYGLSYFALKAFSIVLRLMSQLDETMYFSQPQITDDTEEIKKPIDIPTLRKKLHANEYQEPWQFIADVWLMFESVLKHYHKRSRIYRQCSKLVELFEQKIHPIMLALGYCCGRKYGFQPINLLCFGKPFCYIPSNVTYWSYENRFAFCNKCFSRLSNYDCFGDISPDLTNVSKEQYEKKKNDYQEPEWFVKCLDCNRIMHKICVLHSEKIWPQGFICDNCLRSKRKKRPENMYTAEKLYNTKLSQYIEKSVNSFLQEKKFKIGKVTIRVVSSSKEQVDIKPGFKERYVDSKLCPETFPYTYKAILAFQEIDNVDVCFFGMYTQEYGSECPKPNTRHVYISYVDSVKVFSPTELRTEVYHRILLSYINYCKEQGFFRAYLLACPPSAGADYIFYCHPPEQKVPEAPRLHFWYHSMLNKGVAEGIITSFKDIGRQAKEDKIQFLSNLPYFECEFWQDVTESVIGKLPKEQPKVRCIQLGDSVGYYKIIDFSESKRLDAELQLTENFFSTLRTYSGRYFVINLNPITRSASLPPINDPDPLISSDTMNNRHAFMNKAMKKHWEFSSLRRTKYSTMALLYELHKEISLTFYCKNCAEVFNRSNDQCDDENLCNNCDTSKDKSKPLIVRVHKAATVTEHSVPCLNNKCLDSRCQKLSFLFSHFNSCKEKCNICQQFFALCCYHSKHCENTECKFYLCLEIKNNKQNLEL